MDLKSKKILIAGAGISGIGAAALLGKAGIPAAIYDGNEALDQAAVVAKLPEGMEVSFELGEFKEELADKYDMLILSPGISIHQPVAQAFYVKNKPVWGEIELASHFAKGKIAAITGTNGKTTTTALVGSILREYYQSVFVVGNIGIPFTSVALDTTEDSAIAAEISSFQLETTIDFQPEVSAVLNVTPDHLDRHGTMEVYADTKFSISKKQNKDQVIVLNYDDPITRAMAEKATAHPVMFSRLEELAEGIILRDDTFIIKENGKEMPVCTTSEIKLLGSHNHENILAAIGITYYLLGGGYDKKSTYDEWIDAFHGKVRYLIVMGATAQAIADTAKKHGFHNVIFAETFEEAMDIAREKARPGDAVLLSPACASWGMFKNYEVRGKVFKEIVRKFKG